MQSDSRVLAGISSGLSPGTRQVAPVAPAGPLDGDVVAVYGRYATDIRECSRGAGNKSQQLSLAALGLYSLCYLKKDIESLPWAVIPRKEQFRKYFIVPLAKLTRGIPN